MNLRIRFLTVTLFSLFLSSTAGAQDNWIGIQQSVDVKAYAGKPFRYTASAKTDGSPEILAMIGAQVNRASGRWCYFNNGGNQPVWHAAWTTRTIEGTVDSDAVTLNLGM